jgi:drug/metabolite transporter (DMT)-like permease
MSEGSEKSNIFTRNARLIALFAIAMGSTSGILGKAITASSIAIVFYRLTFALPFFAIPVLLKRREELKALTLRDLAGCGVGGLFLFGHFFSWFNAVKMTNIATAIVLQSLHPFAVLLVTVLLFKRKVKGKAILGICVALVGCAIMAGLDLSAGGKFSGDIFAILAGTFYGLYLCVGTVKRKTISSPVYIFLVFGICWICCWIGMFATGTPFVGYPATDYLWLIAMTLLCQIGAHALFNWVLGYVTPLFLSAWGNAEVVMAMILALIFLGEIPTMMQCIGAVVTIAGLLIYNFNEN